MSTREPRRSRPFLTELLIVAALVWAAAQWLRDGPTRDGRIASEIVRSDPQGTGSIAPSPRHRVVPETSPSGNPDLGAVKSVFQALGALSRR